MRTFVRFAWITLAVTVLVIVWGAVVRATGSGAGCGSHWPLCNGDVVPLAPTTATIIEFTHRLTSGLSLVLTVILFFWSRRLFPSRHPARAWALASLGFMVGEAAIGAGIVLLQLVENNTSVLRAVYQGVHLTNTMLLVGSLTAVAYAGHRAEGGGKSEVRGRRSEGRRSEVRILTLALMILVAAAGAIVALGDTLFPAASLAQGMAADFDATSHFLIRLRIWHPILAAVTALLAAVTFRTAMVITLVLLQVGLGVMNLLALAPLPLQMAHLLVSNLLWIALVWDWFER